MRHRHQDSAELRRNLDEEYADGNATTAPRDSQIVRAAIHPGIGVARIGNSVAEGEDGYYIGPEVVEPKPTLTGETRDDEGAIKRQAARFRIYGYNAADEIVGEIDASQADIQWTVHLANRKAQWYQFQAALDIPEAVDMSVPRRNAKVQGADRDDLAIDPGPRTIDGVNQSGEPYHFTGGAFQGTEVPLGELRTDAAGRLLVLGGLGKSASPSGKPVYIPEKPDTFNNADGWYDDVSDGPVTATVRIAGREVPVEPSWVIVGPPNYAPDVISWRTLYDLLVDSYIECGWLPLPDKPSFTHDILPSLRRLSNLQWVNKGFATQFGKGGAFDFDDPELIAKLARKPAKPLTDEDTYGELRQILFNSFRPSDSKVAEPRTWPWIYGDAFGSFSAKAANNDLLLPKVREEQLRSWVHGEFIDDWQGTSKSGPLPYRDIEQVPLAEQPAMLDQAALHFCIADAFHPGAELTWPMRHTTMYSKPFRIRHRPPTQPEPDYGSKLNQKIALGPKGPLHAQGPGDLTRWMALPWQGDTAFCRSGYEKDYDPYLPTFWPARVPNQVITAEQYDIVMDTNLSREKRLAAFYARAGWLRALHGGPVEQMKQMIADFGKMGIIEQRPGIPGDPDFPEVMLVESLADERAAEVADHLVKRMATRVKTWVKRDDAEEPAAPSKEQRRLEAAGWDSEEQLQAFRDIRIRHD